MKLTLYQADAFSSAPFKGNPAAVIPLKKWLPDELLQNLALENNLSETVFFVPSRKKGADFDIRWFTPGAEVNLCGHATLAASFILFTQLGWDKKKLVFDSKSGPLTVVKKKDWYFLDFPSWKPERTFDHPENLAEMLGVKEIVGVYRHRDLLVELPAEQDVQQAQPDFTALKKTREKFIITAPGKEVDFVSRFFAPAIGVDEDPVTGSAHSQLIPFWSEKLGKADLRARQLSARGGELLCRQQDEKRVLIGGQCVFYMEGRVRLP